jgi:hypothetical protein
MLPIQQVAVCAKTTGKPGQGAGSAHHPMARRDDRDRVAAIRGTHRAHGRGMADLARDLTVAAGLAKRDRQQRRPNDLLKLGALEVERNVESLQASLEVSSQLVPCFDKDRVRCCLDHRSEAHAVRVVVLPQHGGETRIVCHQFQEADGRRGSFEDVIHARPFVVETVDCLSIDRG